MRNKIKIIAGVILIAALIVLGFIVVRGAVGFIQNADVNASEPDPMFAAPAEIVTRPPVVEKTQPPHKTLDDYVPDVETPVDKTAEELGREAQNRG